MEEIYIVKAPMQDESIIAIESMNEMDFAFSKGQAWNEERINQRGYRVRYANGEVWWFTEEFVERAYRKITLKEAEMVAGGQFVISDYMESTRDPA